MSLLLAGASHLSVWSQLIRALTRTHSLDDIYEAALDALAAGIRVQRAAILLFDPDGTMRFKAWRGLSSTYRDAVEGHTPWSRHEKGAQPFGIADVSADASLTPLLQTFQNEGIASLAFVPLEGSEGVVGKFMLYCDQPYWFSAEEFELAGIIAGQVAFAVERTQAQQKIEESAALSQRLAAATESARRQAAFLAEAGSVLSRSLDYEQTFAEVARLAVPEIADWCSVDIIDKEGNPQRLALAHADPAKVEHVRELMRKYPPDPNQPGGVMAVIRTGKPAMVETVPLEFIRERAHDDAHLRILVEFKLTSYICVPMVSASGTLGAMTFAHAESGRHYTERDLTFAGDIAARAALAFENALAYRRAHDANRLKDEFLATLSHELRTPLNAIVGYAHMLNMGILDKERQAKAIAVVKRNADALGQIIADVLDVSRITSGKLRLHVRQVDLPDILRNAVATVQPAADAKGVSLELALESPLARAAGDPDRLQQVVWNLLSNAVKFTPRGGRVRVWLESTADSVEVLISDDGQGIDPAFLPHIFERFRLADSRSSREHGGLGLGLAIVRELVELHGGTVSAVSDGIGKGSMFRVRLPQSATLNERASREAKAFTPSPDQDLPRLLCGVRVLAVDDDADALGLLRVVLESAGAEVATAPSANAAIEQLTDSPFHVMIADIAMPGTDGLHLIRTIRETLPSPTNMIPAAALTAYARSEDRETALASGFQTHIAKPVNPTQLVLAVAALLGP